MITLASLTTLILIAALPTASQAGGDCGPSAYECAVQHVGRQEFGAAIRILDREHAAAPTNLKVLNLLGIALTGAGRVDDANRRFRQALRLDPTFSPALRNLGVNAFARGQLADAERHFVKVLETVPRDEVAHLHLAEIHFARQGFRVALAHYDQAGTRVQQNPAFLLHHASCLIDQGDRPRAIALLDRIPPGDAETRFEAGLLLGRAAAHAEAARFFASARSGYRDPHAAGYNEVLMLVEGGQPEAAIAAAGRLLEGGQKSSELLNLVSRAHLQAGHVKEAYDALRAATVLEPAAEQNYLDLAGICLEHENFDLGMEILEIGLRYRPESLPLHLQRGVLLAQKGMIAQAEGEFETARALAPASPAPYIGLAMSWMQTGQTGKAVEVLRERAKALPEEPMLTYIFGVALVRSGAEPDDALGAEAMAAFEASIRANPRFAASRAELAKLLLKRGAIDRAVQELEQAVALDPEGPGPAYLLARAYQRKGDTARAQEMLHRIAQLRTAEAEGDTDADLRRVVIRIFKEGSAQPRDAIAPR